MLVQERKEDNVNKKEIMEDEADEEQIFGLD